QQRVAEGMADLDHQDAVDATVGDRLVGDVVAVAVDAPHRPVGHAGARAAAVAGAGGGGCGRHGGPAALARPILARCTSSGCDHAWRRRGSPRAGPYPLAWWPWRTARPHPHDPPRSTPGPRSW